MENEQQPAPAVPETPVAASKNNKRLIVIVVIILVIAGIGLLNAGKSPSERMAEELIERSTGGNVDIDVDNGNEGKVTITTKDGAEMQYSAGGNVALPADWPSDMPIMDGGTVNYVGSMNPATGEAGSMVVFEHTQALAAVTTYYEGALADNGWTIDSTMKTGDATILAASKGDRKASLYLGTGDEGKTTVTLTLGS